MQFRCIIVSLLCEFSFLLIAPATPNAFANGWFRLLFMTYNGWVMLAVAVGAFLGYMLFGESDTASGGGATKSVACH